MNNNDLISRSALRELWLNNGQNEHIYSTNDVLDSIDDAQSVDAEPIRHGRWIETNNGFNGFGAIGGKCTECHLYSGLWTINQPYRFCPYCGAKMDGRARQMDRTVPRGEGSVEQNEGAVKDVH